MLRIICPKCKNKGTLGDECRGQTASCPHCGARFRIPAARPVAAAKPASPIMPARAAPAPYAVSPHPAVEQELAPRPRRAVDLEGEHRPRRKKRKRRQSSVTNVLGEMNFFIVLGALGGVAVLSIGLALISPRLAVVPSLLGFIISLVGNIWFLLYAFKESVLWGLGCLLIPFVGVVFLAQHFEETWRPFVVGMIGGAMVMAGTLLEPAAAAHAFSSVPVTLHGR
jgi:hypothetical protein